MLLGTDEIAAEIVNQVSEILRIRKLEGKTQPFSPRELQELAEATEAAQRIFTWPDED